MNLLEELPVINNPPPPQTDTHVDTGLRPVEEWTVGDCSFGGISERGEQLRSDYLRKRLACGTGRYS